MAVVDPTGRKIRIVPNVDDGTDYFHTAVAFDVADDKFIVGKQAKSQVRAFLVVPLCAISIWFFWLTHARFAA